MKYHIKIKINKSQKNMKSKEHLELFFKVVYVKVKSRSTVKILGSSWLKILVIALKAPLTNEKLLGNFIESSENL